MAEDDRSQYSLTTASTWRRTHSDVGASLAGLLVTMVILGGLAAAVIVSVDASGTGHSDQPGLTLATAASAGSGSSNPPNSLAPISAAIRAQCDADYAVVAQAATYYRTLNGHPPMTMSDLSSMLDQPITSPNFTITIGPGGDPEVGAVGHPALRGNGNCAYA